MSGAPTARAAKRDIVAALLETVPGLSGRVYRGQVWPMARLDLPAALVYGWREAKKLRTISAGTHQFDVTCTMVVQVKADCATGEDAEQAAEQIAGDIETALLTAPELAGPQGAVERIEGVESQIKADATGDSVVVTLSIALDLVWTEVHQVVPADLPPPYFDVGISLTT